ncbi:(2Fe-2S)-binding protein [Algicola sagamiensis]|uniref:(2Fe-2S)-binding protein n=1 Tax=Algicola sagamiensis TaxID=163869 RepID=UPI0003A6F24A|nr:(2Fe-2S)-binding protein [Algicola sagamiensis]
MYVCICKAVTDRQIKKAMEAGCTSMREIKSCLGVGSQCGKCVIEASQMVNDFQEKGEQSVKKANTDLAYEAA